MCTWFSYISSGDFQKYVTEHREDYNFIFHEGFGGTLHWTYKTSSFRLLGNGVMVLYFVINSMVMVMRI